MSSTGRKTARAEGGAVVLEQKDNIDSDKPNSRQIKNESFRIEKLIKQTAQRPIHLRTQVDEKWKERIDVKDEWNSRVNRPTIKTD